MTGTLRSGVAKARVTDEACLNEGWALLHQATERCRLLDQRAAERHEQVRKEAEEICTSAADEAEEVLASAREILARAHHEAMEIISEAHQRIPSTIGPPNPALAGEETKRVAQHLLDQARTNALLANAQQRLDEAEDREVLLHACEESANSRAEGLSLQEAGLAVREAEAHDREWELRLWEEQLHALEDRLNREREALKSREEMVNQANSDLARYQEMLNLRESSLQERMDRMLNQRRISLEQEFERRRAENLEVCCTDFCYKTTAVLVRYKQGREALERQVRDLEVELKGADKVHRGAERALAEADATINTLRRDALRLEEENTVMVQQIMEISRELQEARDSEAEARMLCRQCVQMFCKFSARIMEAVNRQGIEGLTLPTILEDDGSILHFFSQLAEKLAEASAKVSELVDAECQELLGLVGMRIFSNIQRLSPDLDLEEVLQRRAPPPPSTPDRMVQARAKHPDIALQRLQALYACPGTSAALGQEGSSSGDTTSSGESGSEGAEEAGDDGVTESSREASSGSSQGTGDDKGFEEDT
jgi:hypothetical protein